MTRKLIPLIFVQSKSLSLILLHSPPLTNCISLNQCAYGIQQHNLVECTHTRIEITFTKYVAKRGGQLAVIVYDQLEYRLLLLSMVIVMGLLFDVGLGWSPN